MEVCGIIHSGNILTSELDETGCILPDGHDGPHEFISAEGRRFQWETDLECTCEHCMEAIGDYCTIYWEVT